MLLSREIKSIVTSNMGKTENVNIYTTLLQESLYVMLRICVKCYTRIKGEWRNVWKISKTLKEDNWELHLKKI